MTDSSCIFCKIVAGEIPAATFWENDDFLAFLAIDPNTPGFSVVIPRAHALSDCLRLSDDLLARFILAAKQVARVLEAHYPDVGRVGVVMEGTGINHAHIKLIPMHDTKDLKNGNWRPYASDKQLWFDRYEGWIASCSGPIASPESLQALAKQLRGAKEKTA